MLDLFSVAGVSEPISPDTTGGEVYERFLAEPDALALAVVDEDSQPVGLVERNSFFLRMAHEWGRALYAKRPISKLMNTVPVVAEGHVQLADFCGEVLEARPSELLHGFIVVHEGRYVGVGSTLDLLRAVSRLNRNHAIEMAEVARHLDAARQEAQAALKARSEFLAVMSHEIRTPLNGVLAVADILARKIDQEDLKPYVQTIIDSGATLMRLVSDAVDLSRASADHLSLNEEPICLSDILDDVAALWAARAAEKGVGLSVSYDGDPGLWALGDAVRLKQVFNNLISNALKFTDEGSVEVGLGVERSGDYVNLRAAIRDTGPGVPEDRLTDIFEPFVQDGAGSSKGGAGLGLSICREIVRRLGGAIWAERNVGPGLTITFEAPLFHVNAPVASAQASPTLEASGVEQSIHVLIADDNATNRLVAETLCQMFGCLSDSVCDGQAAVAALETKAYDLVLMDIKMPIMGGVEATRHIRNQGGPASRIPIIALTANADPWDAEEYLRCGMTAVVEKPIKPALLFKAIEAALGGQAEENAAAA